MSSIHQSDLVDSFFTGLIHQLYSNDEYFDNILQYKIDDDMKNDLQNIMELIQRKCWIYDGAKSSHKRYMDEEIFTRSSLSCFVEKSIAEKLAFELSKHELIVGVHDHNSTVSHLYVNGNKREWNNRGDFIIGYAVKYNNAGNPQLQNIDHVWDYGSHMDTIKNKLPNKTIERYIIDNYIDISIIDKKFKSDISLARLVCDVIDSL